MPLDFRPWPWPSTSNQVIIITLCEFHCNCSSSSWNMAFTTFDSDGLVWPWFLTSRIRSSVGDSEYSLLVSWRTLKLFMRYRGNIICPDGRTNGLTAWKHNAFTVTIGWQWHKIWPSPRTSPTGLTLTSSNTRLPVLLLLLLHWLYTGIKIYTNIILFITKIIQ